MDQTAQPRYESEMEELVQASFSSRQCARCGARIVSSPRADGKPSAWKDSPVLIADTDGALEQLTIEKDEREAPYVVDALTGRESPLMVSLTDENDLLGVAWAEPAVGSRVIGVGFDLAEASDFDGTRIGNRFVQLVFSEFEQALAVEVHPDDFRLGRAFVFSAKEAAFKATSQAVRRWYATHDEKIAFGVRDFQMQPDGTEILCEKRTGSLEKLGIDSIAVTHVAFDGYVACCAVALGV